MRIGFVGCGLIAGFHAWGLSRVDDVTITAVCDTDPARAAAFAEAQGAQAVGSIDEVIAGSDAVYVTTWTSAHADAVAAVAAAGLPVFCEKPLGVDLATARAMTEAVTAAGVVNQVGLVLRHSPAFRWVRAEMAGGAHGPVMSIVFRDDQAIPVGGMYASDWRGDAGRAGAGTLIEHSIHDLDLIEWILGPVASLNGRTAHGHDLPGIEDQGSVLLEGANGGHALLCSTWHDITERPSSRSVEVFCREARFHVTGDWSGPVTCERADGSTEILEGRDLALRAREHDGRHTNPDGDFVAAIRSGTPADPAFTTALRAHELVDATYRSAAAGGTSITLPPPSPSPSPAATTDLE